MSLQASWNAAMGAIAGALHFQDVRGRMAEAESRRQAREAMRKPSQAGSTRESPEGMETEAGRQRIAQAQGEEQQNYENYITNQYAAQAAQDHIAQADTAQNSVSATVEAAKRRRTAPRGLSPQMRERLMNRLSDMNGDEAEAYLDKLLGGNK